MDKSPHVMLAGPGPTPSPPALGWRWKSPATSEPVAVSLVKQLKKEGKPIPPRPGWRSA